MSAPFTRWHGSPLPPDQFLGRRHAVDSICQRLRQADLQGTQVVGGPGSGKTSLLRYLASPMADTEMGEGSLRLRVFVEASALGGQATPAIFWAKVLRELRGAGATAPAGAALMQAVGPTLEDALQRAKAGTLDVNDLEDVFGAFGRQKRPVVLLVDDFDAVLGNPFFLPPAGFFDNVRGLCQAVPRSLTLVVSSRRLLSHVGKAALGPSPFYNHFVSVSLAPLDAAEIAALLRVRVPGAGAGPADAPDLGALIAQASGGHPYLVSYLVDRALDGGLPALDASCIRAAIEDPEGPFVTLGRLIDALLTDAESAAVDAAASGAGLTPAQRQTLEHLRRDGLLPPGIG
jgi:hypothetical protein